MTIRPGVIPILSREEIETFTERFLESFDSECLQRPKATPLIEIANELRIKEGVTFLFESELGFSPQGYKYLGRFHVQRRVIAIDVSLQDDPRFPFTLAHEIGHYVFHRNIRSEGVPVEMESEISDTARHLAFDREQSDKPRDWIEWQANKFASSLLLPRRTLPEAVRQIQETMGINRSRGTIYVDNQQINQADYKSIQHQLNQIYRVSKSAIRVRLSELKLLIQKPASKTGFHSISEILDGIARVE